MCGEAAPPLPILLVLVVAGMFLYSIVYNQVAEVLRSEGSGLVSCDTLEEVTDLRLIGKGFRKTLYRGRLGGKDVIFKTVNIDGLEMQACLSRQESPSLGKCYRKASARLLKEFIILHQLESKSTVKVYGSCVPKNSFGPVVIATELGEPLESIALQQLSWEEKLKLVMGMASLLHLLAHSPLGSLAATDLKRQQFVLVGGRLKLADADDIVISEPRCITNSDCTLPYQTGQDAEAFGVVCKSGVCRGYNEKSNILRAGKDMVQHILLDHGPDNLRPQVMNLLSAYSGVNKWDTRRILKETQALVRLNG